MLGHQKKEAPQICADVELCFVLINVSIRVWGVPLAQLGSDASPLTPPAVDAAAPRRLRRTRAIRPRRGILYRLEVVERHPVGNGPAASFPARKLREI